MKRLFLPLLVLVCAISAYSQTVKRTRSSAVNVPSIGSPVSSLPIRRVVLYSNGVAYIERRGSVTGNAEIDLSFKQSQVDDVLKSMIVLDLGKGKIGAVSYNSSAPASARTAEIPFSVEAESGGSEGGGIAKILSQLQGARVSVAALKTNTVGSILTVNRRVIPAEKDKPAGERNFLVIASDAGEITSFDLAEVRSVKLLDETTKHDISEFANATASTRRRDAKTITVTSNGTGTREMVVSYTIASPIWKTTYRVVLDKDGKPFFQGWAIVDNVSDEDWRDVQLSLVSGSPVSFIQNLQKPLYRYRPIIPIPDDLNLDPQIYDPESGYGEGNGIGDGNGSGSASGSGYSGGGGGGVNEVVEVTADSAVQTSVSDVLVNQQGGIETAASGKEFGDLFEYKISNPVTVNRNRSALIPIVQTTMDGERVSIYNQDVRADRPMGGMMLTNTTSLTFEGGSMTVLDGDAYAGEALMERLKPKERRLISFALDLGTKVSAETVGEDSHAARLVKVVKGVFQVHYFRTEKKLYTVVNQTDRPKTVYIEHPKRKGWGLSDDTQKPDIVTDRFYRFRIELKPFDQVVLPVTERQGLMDSYALSNLTNDQVSLFVTRKYIDHATRQKLEKLISLRQSSADESAKLRALDQEVKRIEEDQKRFRENIESLAKTPEAKTLIARYIAKADEQETRLEEIEKTRKAIIAEKDRLDREWAVEIATFELK